MRPQSSVGFGETFLQAQECGQSYVWNSYWSKGNAGTHFEETRGARIRSRFRSINAHAERVRLKLRWIGYFAKIQEHHCGAYSQQGSAYKRGGRSIRSRSKSFRDSAITRRNVCCSIAWKSLRRPRIFLWVGQPSKTTVDQGGKTIVCKTDNFVPLVVPRLSTCSGSNSSSTSTSQDLSSTSPAQERSDELATRELCGSPSKTKKITRGMAVEMRMTVCEIFLNGWMSFTDNPEDTEVHAPAHISQDSDSERPTKVVSKSRKHSIYTHFPKDRNCEVCLRTQITRALCRRSTGEALPRAKTLVTWWRQIIRSSTKDVNLETIAGTLSWCKFLPLNGFNPNRAKQNLHMRRKKTY